MRWFVIAAVSVGLAVSAHSIGSWLFGYSSKVFRYHVKGTVRWDNSDVPVGLIYFTPDAKQGNSGVQGVARIENGRYDTAAAEGKGCSGGAQVVRILAYDGIAVDESSPMGQLLFPAYEQRRSLPNRSSVLDIEISLK